MQQMGSAVSDTFPNLMAYGYGGRQFRNPDMPALSVQKRSPVGPPVHPGRLGPARLPGADPRRRVGGRRDLIAPFPMTGERAAGERGRGAAGRAALRPLFGTMLQNRAEFVQL